MLALGRQQSQIQQKEHLIKSVLKQQSPIQITSSNNQLPNKSTIESHQRPFSRIMIHYSQKIELIIIFTQVACYANSYIMNLLVFKTDNIAITLLLNFVYIRSLFSLYMANQTHKHVEGITPYPKDTKGKPTKTEPKQQLGPEVQFCRHCDYYVENRDHHCVYTGRCVQKANYQYFFSYVILSYALSVVGLARLYLNQDFVRICWNFDQTLYIGHFMFAIFSHLFFVIFTGMVLAGSVRSIIEGVYVVDNIKQRKKYKHSNLQFFLMCFTFNGLRQLYRDFKENWKNMVGENITLANVLVYMA